MRDITDAKELSKTKVVHKQCHLKISQTKILYSSSCLLIPRFMRIHHSNLDMKKNPQSTYHTLYTLKNCLLEIELVYFDRKYCTFFASSFISSHKRSKMFFAMRPFGRFSNTVVWDWMDNGHVQTQHKSQITDTRC